MTQSYRQYFFVASLMLITQMAKRLKKLSSQVSLIIGLLLPSIALAAYPDHPIKLVVPFAPAGAVDGIARLFSTDFGKN